jgi:oxygen-independent coproporphyrinogen-3 oxidase
VPYLGIGASATTMTQNDERRMRVTDGEVVDDLDRQQMEAEDLMLGMRMSIGVSDERVATAAEYLPEVYDVFKDLENEGFLVHDLSRWRPTTQGWLCGNDLYGRILDLAP